jgi:acyl carrier protein
VRRVGERVTRVNVDQPVVEASEVTPDASFLDNPGAGSRDDDRVAPIMTPEEAFGAETTDANTEQNGTVRGAVQDVEKHAQAVKQ